MQAALRPRILENMSTAVVVLDAGFTVVALNPAAETLLETSARQSVGVPFARVARGDESAELAGRALAGRIDVVDSGRGRLVLPGGSRSREALARRLRPSRQCPAEAGVRRIPPRQAPAGRANIAGS